MKITAYFDGCCEPVNPGGTASFGAVIFADGKRIKDISEVFYPAQGSEKMTSNNVAEYSGLISILNYLSAMGWEKEDIQVYGDSKLVIYQMFGDPRKKFRKWGIKKGIYVPFAQECKKIVTRFKNIKGQWIPREENGIADELSKAELIKAGIEFKIQPL